MNLIKRGLLLGGCVAAAFVGMTISMSLLDPLMVLPVMPRVALYFALLLCLALAPPVFAAWAISRAVWVHRPWRGLGLALGLAMLPLAIDLPLFWFMAGPDLGDMTRTYAGFHVCLLAGLVSLLQLAPVPIMTHAVFGVPSLPRSSYGPMRLDPPKRSMMLFAVFIPTLSSCPAFGMAAQSVLLGLLYFLSVEATVAICITGRWVHPDSGQAGPYSAHSLPDA